MAGRPKEDISSLPKDWYVTVLDLYEEGASDVEIKALIYQWRGRFSNNLWDRWLKEEGQFWETIKMGRSISEAWWCRQGRKSLVNQYQGDSFNSTLWYMNMKNRFGWADKTQTDITSGGEAFVIERTVHEIKPKAD